MTEDPEAPIDEAIKHACEDVAQENVREQARKEAEAPKAVMLPPLAASAMVNFLEANVMVDEKIAALEGQVQALRDQQNGRAERTMQVVLPAVGIDPATVDLPSICCQRAGEQVMLMNILPRKRTNNSDGK